MAHDIFISYASEDRTTADAICHALEARDIRCWIAPRDVLPGEDFYEAIDDAITGCRVMVLVFSASANDSRYVTNEVRLAFDRGVPILPFRIEAVEPSKRLALSIRYAHWLDALTPPLEQHLRRLAESVGRLLNGLGARPALDESATLVKHGGVLALVDVANVEFAARAVGHRLDWLRLREYLATQTGGPGEMQVVLYLEETPASRKSGRGAGIKSQRDFISWAEQQGFRVVAGQRSPALKSSIDIVMATDAVNLVLTMRPDIVVLVSGDSDFVHLAEILRGHGVRLAVAAFPMALSDSLRAVADRVIDLSPISDPS